VEQAPEVWSKRTQSLEVSIQKFGGWSQMACHLEVTELQNANILDDLGGVRFYQVSRCHLVLL